MWYCTIFLVYSMRLIKYVSDRLVTKMLRNSVSSLLLIKKNLIMKNSIHVF